MMTDMTQTFTVQACYDGLWLDEAAGFASAADAQRYIKNAKFWDGFSRRIIEVQA